MFKSKLQAPFIILLMFFSLPSFGQVQVNSVIENNPPFNDCSVSFLQADGQLMAANYAFIGNNVSVAGFNITVDIEYTSGMIVLPAIVPFTQVIDLGILPAGTYNITTNGILNGVLGSSNSSTSVVTSCCSANPAYTLSNTNVCVGELISLTNNSTGTTSQSWYENNVLVSTATDYSVTATALGSYTYKLVVTDGVCSDSVEQTVTVYDAPVVNSITPSPGTICVGDQLYLTGSASNAFSYSWYVDFVPIGSGQSINTTAVGAGSHTVTLIVLSACADSMQTTVDFLAPPVINTSTGDFASCLGDDVVLNATSTGSTSETWFENGMQVGTGSSYSTTPTISGSYTYTYLTSDGSCSDSVITNVMVNDLPVVDLGLDTNSCQGAITLDAGAGFTSYLWQDLSTSQTLVADSGTYYVIVTDSLGCEGSDTIEVTNCVSITELNSLEVGIFPNPVIDVLTIDLKEVYTAVHVRLTDASGRIVRDEIYDSTAFIQLNCSELESGAYLLNVESQGARSIVKVLKD